MDQFDASKERLCPPERFEPQHRPYPAFDIPVVLLNKIIQVPTKENYFGRISKEQISDAFVNAGKMAQAASVLKMKKGDAAQLAEDEMAPMRWVPDCLLPMIEDGDTSPTSVDLSIAA